MIELATAALRKFGELRLRVNGSSMLPAIRPGDVLSIQRCDLEAIRPGDIALFLRDGRLFAHRVISKSSSALVTQGDAIGVPDARLAAADLLGRAVRIQRGGSVLIPGAAGPAGRIAAAIFRRSALAGRLFTRLNALQARAGA